MQLSCGSARCHTHVGGGADVDKPTAMPIVYSANIQLCTADDDDAITGSSN